MKQTVSKFHAQLVQDLTHWITNSHIRVATDVLHYVTQYRPQLTSSTYSAQPAISPLYEAIKIVYIDGIAMYSDGHYVYNPEHMINKKTHPAIIGVIVHGEQRVIFLPH